MIEADRPIIYQGGYYGGAARFRVAVRKQEAIAYNCSICYKKGFLHLIVPLKNLVCSRKRMCWQPIRLILTLLDTLSAASGAFILFAGPPSTRKQLISTSAALMEKCCRNLRFNLLTEFAGKKISRDSATRQPPPGSQINEKRGGLCR